MELALNIYDGDKIIRTYKADRVTLTTGIVEDILQGVDIDSLMSKTRDDKALGTEILKIIARSFSKFKPFFKSVFKGMTDEEYRMTKVSEVAGCVVQIVTYAINEIFAIGDNAKN